MNEEKRQIKQQVKHLRKQGKRNKTTGSQIALVVFLLLILCVATAGILLLANGMKKDHKSAPTASGNIEIETPQDTYVNFLAVGDVLFHEPVMDSGKKEDGSRNYNHLYQYVKADIEKADLAAANQETIFVTGNTFSGDPKFASPVEGADALVQAGFDIVTHATNHTYDRGRDAILQTMNYWKTKHGKIAVLGIGDTPEAMRSIQVIEREGIRFAMLNYTEITNCPTEGANTLLNIWSSDKAKQDVAAAKEMADIVICFLHAGVEYSKAPGAKMQSYAKLLAELGVDVMIGAHPHVLQGCEMVKAANGNEMLAYYSLGNFVSRQKEVQCLLGGMADITFVKDVDTEEIYIKEYSMIPVVTHYGQDNTKDFAVYKLEDYTNELAARHGIHAYTRDEFTVEALKRLAEQAANGVIGQ